MLGLGLMYRVIRFFRDDEENNRMLIEEDLSLEEAQEHCQNPETSSSTATSDWANKYTEKHGPWFDGYEAYDE